MKTDREEDNRREDRTQLIGDILWSYATNEPMPQYEGTLIDLSKSGLNMFTQRRVRDGAVLRLTGKGLWLGTKFATVMWCEKAAPDIYRVGLLLHKAGSSL